MSVNMTSKERMLAAIAGEPVDRVPCSVSFNELRPELRKGYTWQFPWQSTTPVEEKLRYQVEELGLDQVINVSANIIRPMPEISSKVVLDGEVLHKTYYTPAGELHASVRYNELWPHGKDIPFYSDFNVGHYIDPWIQSESDLECFMQVNQLALTGDVLSEVKAGIDETKKLAGRYELAVTSHVGMGLTGAQHLFGATQLCLMTIDNPELVDAYLAYEHRINLKKIEVLGDSHAVDIIHRNGFYETADFYSPEMLEQFLGTRLRGESEAIHTGGMVMAYTAHTGIMPILDYLAALPLDSIFGIDTAFNDIDMEAVRSKLSPAKSFWTGPSSTYHLWKGPEVTRQAVRDVFDVFGKTGLILTPCVSTHAIIPWESTIAMIDEWRQLR